MILLRVVRHGSSFLLIRLVALLVASLSAAVRMLAGITRLIVRNRRGRGEMTAVEAPPLEAAPQFA